jgi:IclR family acetate operon transcriptional repressor
VTGLPRPTVARTLATLADTGLVERSTTDQRWLIGHELISLARAGDPHRSLIAAATPIMQQLLARAQESVLLGVPRPPDDVELLAQLDAPHLVGVTDWVGRSFPSHASAAGRLTLAALSPDEFSAWLERTPLQAYTERTIVNPDLLRAELARVRHLGYAELVDEYEIGLTSLAAPVHADDQQLTAMIGVSGPTFRLTRTRRKELAPHIKDSALELRRSMYPTATPQ